MADRPLILDYTTLSTFLTCRKKHYWRNVRNLVAVDGAVSLAFGHSTHGGWAVFYKGEGDKATLKAFACEYKDFPVPEGDKRTLKRGMECLEDYTKRYQHNPFKVINVEVSHQVKIHPLLTYAARMDLIIKWEGRIYVMEHKTASKLGSYFFDAFKLNHQVDGYFFACMDKYGECHGVWIDAMLIAKTKFNCLRDIVGRGPKHKEEFIEELLDIEKNMRWAEKEQSYPLDKGSCDYYGACVYKDLCYYRHDKKILKRVIETRYTESVWDAAKGREVKDESKHKKESRTDAQSTIESKGSTKLTPPHMSV